MELPQEFTKKMSALLGKEAEDFFHSYQEPRASGLRLNVTKTGAAAWEEQQPFQLEKIPFVPAGYYFDEQIDKPGKHPYHAAGLYYIQEPSAMFVAEQLQVEAGDKVLDLCAAPGGKSTQIAAGIGENGFLLANEIHPKRVRALSENIERFGLANTVVTNETPERLSRHFQAYFDKILVDAPCSGEGMFRKDPGAAGYWRRQHVEACAQKQREILKEAHEMLKPGGILVYSTCTFSPEENEQTIEDFLDSFPDMELLPIPHQHGIQPGRPEWAKHQTEALSKTARLWPHCLKGEGHFAAKLYKKPAEPDQAPAIRLQPSAKLSKQQEKDWVFFQDQALPLFPTDGRAYFQFKNQLYLLPHACPALNGLHLVRPGLHLGEFKKNRFEPNHALALALGPGQCRYTKNLAGNSAACLRYLKGETLPGTAENRGWILVTVDGFPLGWSKEANGILKNLYPKGLRMTGNY
ncbi:RsmF rRNA methyltransferase first C-terminal domain-containing protein [Heyndrickxia acidiproducens]|uniref:RsmF rRNA methyltransferase first C-terminal domain-containing protein n=1 Tax=Heyndrickxia acidiproducens TaxID=1121084 RepID=UPI00037BB234|nr:RsmF rRNA methyltransferase first C-terminal domain-containing protein [Heyndrickxia acidiproducens]